MPQREQNDRGAGSRLRAALVTAAADLLLSPQPLTPPSLRAVARACAVSPAAVYLHFASQQALLTAVVDAQFDELRDVIHAALADEHDPALRLERFSLAYVEWGVAHPGGYQLIFEAADRPGMPVDHGVERWDLLREAGELLVAASSGAPIDDQHAQTLALWAALHGIVSLRIHKLDVVWSYSRDDDVRRALARHLRR